MKNQALRLRSGQGGYLSIILAIVIAMVLMSGAAFFWYKSDMGKDVKQEASIILKKDAIEEEEEISEENNWESYTDNDFGINFQYPDNYEMEVSSDKITISQKHLDSEIYIAKFSKDVVFNTEGTVYNRSVEVINNLTYREFWRQKMGNSYGYVLHDDYGYYIFESTTGPDNEVFEDLIKTVSLKQETPLNPGVDWQTYTDDKYKFSFKYPSEWQCITAKEMGLGYTISVGVPKEENCDSRRPSVLFMVDPYGFGHFSIDKDMSIEKLGDGFHITEEIVINDEEFDHLDTYNVIASERSDVESPRLWMSFVDDSKNEKEWDETIRKIIASFKFSEDEKTSDVGKECKDSSECESYCITDLPEVYLKSISENGPMEMTGNCASKKSLKGCFSIVEDGFVSGTECIK